MPEAIRTLLLDDHTLFRAMLGRLLDAERDVRVVAHCSKAIEALQALKEHPVNLLLLDYDLGNQETGLQFIRRAREAGYSGRILIVTAGMPDSEYVRALGLGVNGIFLKHSSPELLIEAIHRVASGETWIDPHCIQALVDAVEGQQKETRSRQLTDREGQILRGVLEGLSNKEIAAQLNLSEASVKSGLQQLFVKTGVRTRSQLVRVALEEFSTDLNLRRPSGS